MYSEDTGLCLKSKDIAQLNEAINVDLERIDSRWKGIKLSLNVAKTRSMLIASKPKHRKFNNAGEKLNLEICGRELDVIKKTKYPGVQLTIA